VAGAVCPAGIVTVGAEILTLEESLLAREIVTDAAGADANVTFSGRL
jgi:hypothetical protein